MNVKLLRTPSERLEAVVKVARNQLAKKGKGKQEHFILISVGRNPRTKKLVLGLVPNKELPLSSFFAVLAHLYSQTTQLFAQQSDLTAETWIKKLARTKAKTEHIKLRVNRWQVMPATKGKE